MHALVETLQQTDASRPAAVLADRFDAATRAEPVAPLSTLEALATLDASTPVRWRASLPVRVSTIDDRVRIVGRAKTLSLPVEAEQAVRRLAAGGAVTPGELPGLDAESAVVVVRRLVREGFVVAPA
jgi:hypothetical protein